MHFKEEESYQNIHNTNRQMRVIHSSACKMMLLLLCLNRNGFGHGLGSGIDAAVAVGWFCAFADLIHNIHAIGHIAEHAILTVQIGAAFNLIVF